MHSLKILEWKQDASGVFSVKMQCCGDEKHTHWHTMHSSVASDPAKLQESLNAASAFFAQEHETALKAKEVLEPLIGTELKHEL